MKYAIIQKGKWVQFWPSDRLKEAGDKGWKLVPITEFADPREAHDGVLKHCGIFKLKNVTNDWWSEREGKLLDYSI